MAENPKAPQTPQDDERGREASGTRRPDPDGHRRGLGDQDRHADRDENERDRNPDDLE